MLFQLNPDPKTNKLIVYFHGNAEDGGHSYFVNQVLLKTAKAHVVTVEYPGYGIYEHGSKFPNEKLMF